MAYSIHFRKSKKTKTRRLSILPRVGLFVDFGGRTLAFRGAPFLETMVNLIERGLSTKNHNDISSEQLHEIQFPVEEEGKTIDVEAKTLTSHTRARKS